MFATIRKHQTWLWAFIIAAVIISFVIYFTPSMTQDRSGGGATSSYGSIHGRPISQKEYAEAYVEAQVSYFLRSGSWPDSGDARRSGFNAHREARNRLVLLDRVQALNIHVAPESVANYIVENFGGDKPETAKSKYDGFVQMLEKQHHVREDTFQTFIRHEIAITHMVQLAGVAGGLVAPRVATSLFREENEKVEALAAVFSTSNYLASAQVDPAGLGRFYTNRQGLYRTPDKVRLNYVKFDRSNYLAQADQALARDTNFAANIERYYLSSNPNAFTETNGQPMTAEAAKSRLRQQAREGQALAEAHKAAARFGKDLETVTNLTSETLPQLATARGLTVGVTDPFSETEPPRGLKVMQNFLQMAFKLSSTNPVSISPIRGEDAVYLIALNEKIPSQVPPLDSIRPRVELEFKQDWAANQARAAGTNLLQQLTNGLAAGKTFEAVCTEAGVTPVALPKFSLARQPQPDWDRRVDLNQARAAAANLGIGKFSSLLSNRDGVFILFIKARHPVPDSELKADLPKFVENLRESRQYEAFADWFRKQVELTRIETTLGKDE